MVWTLFRALILRCLSWIHSGSPAKWTQREGGSRGRPGSSPFVGILLLLKVIAAHFKPRSLGGMNVSVSICKHGRFQLPTLFKGKLHSVRRHHDGSGKTPSTREGQWDLARGLWATFAVFCHFFPLKISKYSSPRNGHTIISW